jgi:uncharacterized NAD-dependent epimerase/dehydratase family protein
MEQLHFFSGKIKEVQSIVVAVLGTDSAVGKRTTAWMLVDALEDAGATAELVGTGQTAWMQGVRHGLVLDALPNDFVAGEIEHAVWCAWKDGRPDVIVVEGQGSLMHPAYPGGFEILAAARPEYVILQHAPGRKDYDGFDGIPVHPVTKQIQAIELIADTRVLAIAINRENLAPAEMTSRCRALNRETGLPVFDVLEEGAAGLVDILRENVPFGRKPWAGSVIRLNP